MSPHSHPPSNLFLFSLHNLILKICKQKHLAKFRKKLFPYKRTHKESIKHHTLRRYTRKSHTYNQKGTQTNSFQPLQLEKHISTPPNFPQNYLQNPRNRQTQRRFPSNAKEFTAKHRSILIQTQKSFR